MHSDLKHEWSGEDDGAEKRQQEIIPAVPVWVSGDVLIMQYRCNQHLSLQIRHLGDYHFKIWEKSLVFILSSCSAPGKESARQLMAG